MPSDGLLKNWIRSYKENGYVIVEKVKGRPSTMNKNKQFNKTYEDMTPEEKVAVVCELQRQYPLRILLEISGLKRSTYYYTLSKIYKGMKSNEIMNIIIDIFCAHKERYGYRRIVLELRNTGYVVNHKKVKR